MNKETKKDYKYYAFISYSHKDQKEALSFHKYLEHYKLPKSVKTSLSDAPEKFAPVFLDRDNLSGTKLDDRLQNALRESDYLIVICSPSSAKSSYVNDEVLYFRSLGREDHIIPYIIGGKPDADTPDNECYTPALKEIDPLGADVQDLGRWKARLRVIASMLELDLDLLVKKENRRKRIKTGCLIASILIIAVGTWIPYDYYKIPKTSYYQDYVEINGIPHGIGEKLTKKQHQEKLGCYSITTRAGKVRSLSYVNAAGQTIEPIVPTVKDESATREYTYDDNGELSEIQFEDAKGNVLTRWDYSNKGTEVSLRDEDDNTVSFENFSLLLSQETIENEKTNGIKGYRMIYDDETGYLKKKIYTAYAGSQDSEPDDNGTYGREYEYTDDGQVYRFYYLDDEGERTSLKCGAAYIENTYDDQGRLLTQSSYDSEGKPIIDSDSIFSIETKYEGLSVTQCTYDLNGKCIGGASWGAAESRAVYDKNANLRELSYYDAGGNPCIGSDGYARCTMEYDEKGYQISCSFFDADYNPLSINGYQIRTREYKEEDGNIACTEKYLDENGEITLCDGGYAMLKQITDSTGNVLLIEYYDTDGKLIAGEAGYARAEATRNADGQEEKVSYYDREGNPYLVDGCYASVSKEYENGQCTDVYYYDAEGNVVCNAKGYAHRSATYNTWGKIISTCCYNTDDVPVLSADGYSSVKFKYDDNGNVKSCAFFDTDSNPMLSEDGYHEIQFARENGRITKVTFYDIDNKALLINGAHKVEMDRDLEGNVISLRNYGIHSENVICEDGYYSCEKEYDSYRNLILCAYYDTNGNLIVNKDLNSIVKFEYQYNERGEKIQSSIWSLDGDGIIKRVTENLEKSLLVSVEYFNTDGSKALKNKVHKIAYVYDVDDTLTEMDLYGLDNELLYRKIKE